MNTVIATVIFCGKKRKGEEKKRKKIIVGRGGGGRGLAALFADENIDAVKSASTDKNKEKAEQPSEHVPKRHRHS